jgi:hypothetical protein
MMTIAGTIRSSGGICPRTEVEVTFLFDQAICATPEDMERAVPGRPIVLVGKGSAVGLNLEKFEFSPPP